MHKHIDLRKKKMRRNMMILIILMSAMTCKGQQKRSMTIGTDLTSVLRNSKIGIFMSISAHANWSVSAECNIRIKDNLRSDEELLHIEDLLTGNPGHMITDKSLISTCVSAQYWPGTVFKGSMISFGLGTSQEKGISVPVAFGYMFDIWKGVKAGLCYNIEIIDTIRYDIRSANGMRICLGYEF